MYIMDIKFVLLYVYIYVSLERCWNPFKRKHIVK